MCTRFEFVIRSVNIGYDPRLEGVEKKDKADPKLQGKCHQGDQQSEYGYA